MPSQLSSWKDGRIVRASEDYGRWAAAVASSAPAAFVGLSEIIARRYDALGPQKVEALFGDEHTHTNAPGAEQNAVSSIVALKGFDGCPLCAHLSPQARDIGTEKAKDE